MTMLLPGDAAPWFRAPALSGNPNYNFDQAAGRAIVMLFLGRAAWPPCAAALALVERHRHLFDDENACFFGVSLDPADAAQGRIRQQLPGIRWFLDHDGVIARVYGACRATGEAQNYQPHWLLLDPMLRVVRRAPIDRGAEIFAALDALRAAPNPDMSAPVLILPRVFEPAMCRRLIELYETHGGEESGFMQEVAGRTIGKLDHRSKRRSDYVIEDEGLREQIARRLSRFLLPQLARAFQFKATRIERYLVACYDGDNGGGYFRAHRDNTTKGTAHRRFACTINLNAEDFEGGELCFPEFGPRTYRAPTGGAVVFSCSLLHEARPVVRGRRFAFLPFFYDEESARLREANAVFIGPAGAGG
ncbi:2OG-Fe(II) oxygenase [Sphingomonas quercus]|uniref:2OG-Fe(II) oxygenase n=1 Tax=Sphingomonas quercus TaxID=2842451 RepID=A0ABS6BKI0_9SPHN|nr:2OG-Fe(II) oxygenase [Sphingomonas quercus]MBU3078810.1 2OG-Fe(II) oxygenase [Sphingomonas quercus]